MRTMNQDIPVRPGMSTPFAPLISVTTPWAEEPVVRRETRRRSEKCIMTENMISNWLIVSQKYKSSAARAEAEAELTDGRK